jgi:hypothetical protein
MSTQTGSRAGRNRHDTNDPRELVSHIANGAPGMSNSHLVQILVPKQNGNGAQVESHGSKHFLRS